MAKTAATARGAGTQSSMLLVGILALIAQLLASYRALWAGRAGPHADRDRGRLLTWPTLSTVVLVLAAVLVVAALTGVATLRRGGGTTAVDAKAKLMAPPTELTGVTGNQAPYPRPPAPP